MTIDFCVRAFWRGTRGLIVHSCHIDILASVELGGLSGLGMSQASGPGLAGRKNTRVHMQNTLCHAFSPSHAYTHPIELCPAMAVDCGKAINTFISWETFATVNCAASCLHQSQIYCVRMHRTLNGCVNAVEVRKCWE